MFVIAAPHGDKNGGAPALLAKMLDGFGGASLLCGGRLSVVGSSRFLVACCPIREVLGDSCILWLYDGAVPPLKVGENVPVLASSGPAPATSKLITYGFGARDTVTVSSISPGRAVASILRPITTLSGKLVEPSEIPLTIPPETDVLTALAAATILTLCDIALPEFDLS